MWCIWVAEEMCRAGAGTVLVIPYQESALRKLLVSAQLNGVEVGNALMQVKGMVHTL